MEIKKKLRFELLYVATDMIYLIFLYYRFENAAMDGFSSNGSLQR
jgi:hypothetical protein